MRRSICSAFVVFAFLTAVGCDDSSRPKIDKVGAQKDSEAIQQGAESAVYLPGGGALQFAKKAKSNELKFDSKGVEHRSVIFEFSDPVSDVYTAVDGILKEQGYSASLLRNSNYKYFVRYQKDGKSVVVGFREVVSEGFSKFSSVLFWWPV